jgi:hypothetical protein
LEFIESVTAWQRTWSLDLGFVLEEVLGGLGALEGWLSGGGLHGVGFVRSVRLKVGRSDGSVYEDVQ